MYSKAYRSRFKNLTFFSKYWEKKIEIDSDSYQLIWTKMQQKMSWKPVFKCLIHNRFFPKWFRYTESYSLWNLIQRLFLHFIFNFHFLVMVQHACQWTNVLRHTFRIKTVGNSYPLICTWIYIHFQFELFFRWNIQYLINITSNVRIITSSFRLASF